ncbi:MAG: MATE family efflux transporter [Clostridia bacterium]|nr:MATE family efflux transporter [Clostridia bacterium]
MQKTMVRDLTRGPVVPLLFKFAMPLFFSNALQAVYNLVDMVVVGQVIGDAGMSAVSIGGDILHLLTFIAMGFASAGQVLIARAVGEQRPDDIRKTIGTMFTLLLSTSVGIALICFGLRHHVLQWLNTPGEALDYTMDYMVTCIVGLPFIYGYNIVSAILRGMGDSKRPFVFIAVAAVLNTALDLLFVAVFKWEVFGAALATVIGQGISFVASIIYLYKKREAFGFDFKPASFRPDPVATKRLLALGIPMAIQSAAINLSKIVLSAWINATGVENSALAGVYNKINMMAGIISQSFTTAGSSMTGQNLGARAYKRVNVILATVLTVGLVIAVLGTGAMLLWPDAIYGMFNSKEGFAEAAAVLTLPIILNLFGSATRSAAFSLINGSGRSNLNLAVAIIDGVISRVGLAALLGFALNMECKGFWLGDALAGFMPFVIGGTFYLSGRWKMEKKQA